MNETGVASSEKSCYNFVEDNYIDRSVKRKVDSLFGVDYGVYAKALLRLLEIRITHSRHVETVIMMKNCGFKKK
ncbi:hypothetical protein CLOSTHATH_00654 [Hungatella hathewayi DSM 13479]|uniref:Uncharacterized protein n=1 Tax=Hungatella hathewayi DSM 13479 TaxID=566550 RepID=D3AAN3_9FIRM|nr:hypothetical protein CLOSTHATH_00654 [Hungatella hathewayi DSM 13479]RHB66399.1 hypothetical protein DW876_22210 [Hungatella hathewayi]